MADTDNIAISVKNVSKAFKLPHEKQSSVKGAFVGMFSGKRKYERQQVLKDVSFDIKKGEFFGIVGRNGSGKSTLLKLMAGIYSPDKGRIQVNGKLTPFIELGVGFNPELTGRENVFLNGALLGFSRKEMSEMYDEIVEFAELEKFMDQKLKNYSSGMQVRLAFSIAIRANTDILVLDEVLAVGDEAFQRKCFEYFAELKKDKKTVVLVTHDMNSARRFCTKGILIDSGLIVESGSISIIAKQYEDLNKPEESEQEGNPQDVTNKNNINSVVYINSKKSLNKIVQPDEDINIEIVINPKMNISDVLLGCVIEKSSGEQVFWATTEHPNEALGSLTAGKSKAVNFRIQNIFGEGKYFVNIAIKNTNRTEDFLMIDKAAGFTVSGRGKHGWMLHPSYDVKVIDSLSS